MVHSVILAIHIVAGSAGLVLGLPAMRGAVRRRGRTPSSAGYQGAVTVLAVTAVALAVMNWARLWPFALIAVATEAAVVAAGWVASRRFERWLPWHVRLLCGSYISLVTALLVVSWGSWAAWVAPIVVGAPIVERAASRARIPVND